MTDDLEPRRLVALADEIRTEVSAAEADFQSAVQHGIKAGEKLIEAKDLVKHGEWLPWLEANFDGSERTARNYMALARNRQRVADLPSIREAVALLTEPKPDPIEEARQWWRDADEDERVAMAQYVSPRTPPIPKLSPEQLRALDGKLSADMVEAFEAITHYHTDPRERAKAQRIIELETKR